MGNYEAMVALSTFPQGLTQTYDNDGILDNTSTTPLTDSEPDDLDQDFGYQPNGSIGDTVWFDTNDDGIIDPGENGIEGVSGPKPSTPGIIES